MDIVNLLEQLAKSAHFSVQREEIINLLPTEIKEALLKNNASDIKKQISVTNYYANESHVVSL